MEENKEIVYPVTKETMHAYAKSIFDPILKGESVTTIWVPMAGRRMWNKFLVENVSLFKDQLPDYQNYILVYVEPLDLTEESLVGYLRLMAKSFASVAEKDEKITIPQSLLDELDKSELSYPKLLDILRKLLRDATESGFVVGFFLGEFDELPFVNKIFCNNLKSLWSSLYPRLQYVFPLIKTIDIKKDIYLWDELSEAVLQNVRIMSLPQGADCSHIIKFFADRQGLSLTEEVSTLLIDLSGGHPYMIKTALRAISDMDLKNIHEIKEHLVQNRELRSIAYGIYDKRSPEEKLLLKKISRGVQITEAELEKAEVLLQLGLLSQTPKNQLSITSDLLGEVISDEDSLDNNETSTQELTFNDETSAISYNGKSLEENFTRQEYTLLSSLLKAKGTLLTKEGIGEALWGDNSYEQYSDWAIDQLMSKLRKKLKNLGVSAEIVTLRGRGYVLKVS